MRSSPLSQHSLSRTRQATPPRWTAVAIATAGLALACAGRPPPPALEPETPVPVHGRVEGVLRVVTAKPNAEALGRAVLFLEAETPYGPSREVSPLRLSDVGFEDALRAVGPGASVEVVNTGSIHHRVFWLDGGRRVDRVLAPGDHAPIDLPERGVLRLYCDLHAEEFASVFVAPSRHHAVVDFENAYALEDVTPGSWTLSIWSERIEGPIRRVEVEAGEVSHEDVWIDPRRARIP